MKIHEKTCKENPNRVKKIHKKAKCQFCKKKWLLYISKITKTFVFKTQLKKKELKLTKMVFVKLYIKKNQKTTQKKVGIQVWLKSKLENKTLICNYIEIKLIPSSELGYIKNINSFKVSSGTKN